MVGQRTLDPFILVRIQAQQQGTIRYLALQVRMRPQPDTDWYLCKYEILLRLYPL